MRIVAPALLASLLLGIPLSMRAADKNKIEVVEANTKIGLGLSTSPGTPEQIYTNCNNIAGVNCTSTVTPATEPSSSLVPQILVYEIKVILPSGVHFVLSCVPSPSTKKCKSVESSKSDSHESGACFMEAMSAFLKNRADTDVKTCTAKNLGYYRVKYDGYTFVIHTDHGKVEYRITGSW
jgi:hypothetical protein